MAYENWLAQMQLHQHRLPTAATALCDEDNDEEEDISGETLESEARSEELSDEGSIADFIVDDDNEPSIKEHESDEEASAGQSESDAEEWSADLDSYTNDDHSSYSAAKGCSEFGEALLKRPHADISIVTATHIGAALTS